MSSRDGPTMCGKRRFRARDDDVGVVHAQRRLRQVSHLGVGRQVQPVHVRDVLHQPNVAGRLAHGAEHLIVPLVADEQDGVALARKADGLEVDLGDERTGGVDGAQAAFERSGPDGRGDAVGAVQDRGPLRDLVDAVHEDDAALAEALDDGPVVNDFVIDVERRAVQLQGPFQALDRHVDAGAEPARVRQDDLHIPPPRKMALS